MKHSELLEALQNLIGFKPPAKAFVKMLDFSSEKIFYTRAQRDSNYTEEELQKIEQFYCIEIPRSNEKPIDAIEADYYPEVFGSCGGGAFVLSETKEKMIIPKKSLLNFSASKKYSIINALGDSMHPYILDKDKLVVEHLEYEPIKDNRVYVFCYNEQIYVKRLIKNVKELIIKSDNPDPIYKPIVLEGEEMNDIYIIGQIVGIIREVN